RRESSRGALGGRALRSKTRVAAARVLLLHFPPQFADLADQFVELSLQVRRAVAALAPWPGQRAPPLVEHIELLPLPRPLQGCTLLGDLEFDLRVDHFPTREVEGLLSLSVNVLSHGVQLLV